MTEADNNESEKTIEEDPIEVIHQGECLSLSGRSTLTYAIGRHAEDGILHFAITGNSGGGMWCRDWVSASDIQDLVFAVSDLTAKSLEPLWPSKSVNTLSFALSGLRDLGLIEVNPEQTRKHRHVNGMTFERCVSTHTADHAALNTKRRKSKEG